MEEFRISTRTLSNNPDITVMDLEGVCNHETADGFEQAVNRLLAEGRVRIILNLEKLTYISSRGLGNLMNAIKQARDMKGDILMVRVTPGVASIFDLLDIPQLFRFFKNEENAVLAFSIGSSKSKDSGTPPK